MQFDLKDEQNQLISLLYDYEEKIVKILVL